MYARVTTLQLHPDSADRMVALARDAILPAARQQPGFQGVFVLGERRTGKGYAITLWETEAAVQQSQDSEYLRQTMAQIAPLVSGAPTQDTLEVLFHEEV